MPLGKRNRRRGLTEGSAPPFSAQTNARTREAVRAYRLSTWGLIPGLGLFLGPVAVVLAMRVRRRGRDDPEFKGGDLAKAAILLGAALTLTNWLGLLLMILGLRQ